MESIGASSGKQMILTFFKNQEHNWLSFVYISEDRDSKYKMEKEASGKPPKEGT